MVLSDRFGNRAPRGLVARTAMYVVGFGGAALLMALVLSFTFVSLAEGMLPKARVAAEKSKAVKVKGGSKKEGSRANQATDPQDDAEGSR